MDDRPLRPLIGILRCRSRVLIPNRRFPRPADDQPLIRFFAGSGKGFHLCPLRKRRWVSGDRVDRGYVYPDFESFFACIETIDRPKMSRMMDIGKFSHFNPSIRCAFAGFSISDRYRYHPDRFYERQRRGSEHPTCRNRFPRFPDRDLRSSHRHSR